MRFLPLIVVLLLSGCASPEIRPLRPFEIATAPYHYTVSETIVGSLMYEGGCLLFLDEDRTRHLLPVWPTGTKFEESLVTFHPPAKAEERLVIGEEIRMDGQAVDWSQVESAEFAPFHQQCGAQPFYVSNVTPAN